MLELAQMESDEMANRAREEMDARKRREAEMEARRLAEEEERRRLAEEAEEERRQLEEARLRGEEEAAAARAREAEARAAQDRATIEKFMNNEKLLLCNRQLKRWRRRSQLICARDMCICSLSLSFRISLMPLCGS